MTSGLLPLSGMVVLDLTQIMPGPVCTMLLADMGADVIKLERPNGGDDTWRMAPPFLNGLGAGFLALNRNKLSLALNLQKEEGKKVFRKLLQKAEVVVETFRPCLMARLGLGYEELAELKPDPIYCTISGFGRTGPLPQSWWVRPCGSGYERLDEHHRLSRQSTGQGECAHHRHLSGAAGGQRHFVRLYSCPQDLTGTDVRYFPAGGRNCLHHLGVVQLFC